jgi:hypothetical protein
MGGREGEGGRVVNESDRELLRRAGIVLPEGAKSLGVNLDALGAAPAAVGKKPGKYRNEPTEYNGVRYDSKAEAKRAEYLDGLHPTGVRWVGQPRFRLGVPENVYVADFLVWGPQGVRVEDVKGAESPKFRRDKRLWAAYGPAPLWIIRGGKCVEIIEGGRS